MLSFVITLKETKVLISFRNQSLPVQHVLVSIGVFNRQLVKLHQLLFNKDKLGCPTTHESEFCFTLIVTNNL